MDLQVLLAMGANGKKKKNHITNSQHLSNGDDAHINIYFYTFSSHVVEHMKEIFFHQH
jgi:hypothetical protein